MLISHLKVDGCYNIEGGGADLVIVEHLIPPGKVVV